MIRYPMVNVKFLCNKLFLNENDGQTVLLGLLFVKHKYLTEEVLNWPLECIPLLTHSLTQFYGYFFRPQIVHFTSQKAERKEINFMFFTVLFSFENQNFILCFNILAFWFFSM